MSRTEWLLFSGCFLATVAASLAAFAAARRDRSHLPLALTLAAFAAIDLATRAAQAFVLCDAPRPFAGAARALYHVETALQTAWPIAVALCVLATFRAPRWASLILIGAWAVNAAQMAAAYPLAKGTTRPRLLAVELAALFVCAIAANVYRATTRAQAAALSLVVVEVAIVGAGPWATNVFTDRGVGWFGYSVGFTAMLLLYKLWEREGMTCTTPSLE